MICDAFFDHSKPKRSGSPREGHGDSSFESRSCTRSEEKERARSPVNGVQRRATTPFDHKSIGLIKGSLMNYGLKNGNSSSPEIAGRDQYKDVCARFP
jgi:hypothetical protein